MTLFPYPSYFHLYKCSWLITLVIGLCSSYFPFADYSIQYSDRSWSHILADFLIGTLSSPHYRVGAWGVHFFSSCFMYSQLTYSVACVRCLGTFQYSSPHYRVGAWACVHCLGLSPQFTRFIRNSHMPCRPTYPVHSHTRKSCIITEHMRFSMHTHPRNWKLVWSKVEFSHFCANFWNITW
jgi:hypothetical protein